VIIGGTSGIGLSAATACAREGAKVVALGLDEATCGEARAALGKAGRVLAGDATTSGTAEKAIEEALSAFGGFHGLYHVAGGSGRKWGDGPLHEISDEGWARTIALNQTSAFYSNRAALNAFLQRGDGGAIVNMASVVAFSPSPKYFATHAYTAAKAAIIGMTQTAAAYYAKYNIRVNAIAPGCTDTPMAARAKTNAEIQSFLRRKQPLDGGRMEQPEDVDGAAVFLLSDAARFITGQVLAVDGGWSVSDAAE
jgi:NAD(P)-dependent dehydrogenase (short-subunit alcohol dehydrogenase family)